MPYTPPSRPNPDSSRSGSPNLTRNHSYDRSFTFRPDLPRSRSAAYIRKHRRTPLLTSDELGQTDHIHSSNHADEYSLPAPEATISSHLNGSASAVLTSEVQKISNSKSSDVDFSHTLDIVNSRLEGLLDDNEDDGQQIKSILPPKKSGELVKPTINVSSLRSPSSMPGNPTPKVSSSQRPLSTPGTPNYPKVVHFNEDMEQVHHFLQVDRPISIKNGDITPSQTPLPRHGDQNLSSRYDFNESLRLALSTAQQALEEKSSVEMKRISTSEMSAQTSSATVVQPVDESHHDKISPKRPDLNSAQYKDLIQKYCYVHLPVTIVA
jgi:hypothetical protein